MPISRIPLFSFLVLPLLLASCAGRSASGSAPGAGGPVARVDGVAIAAAELEAEARTALSAAEARHAEEAFSIRSRALEALVDTRLLEAEAGRRGVTVEELLRREVDARVAEPDEAALRSVWEATRANGRTVPPFAEARAEIGDFVKGEARRELRQALLGRLRGGVKVESFLTAPLPEKVAISAEGPTRGRRDAVVTIVEFSDYECRYCAEAEPVVRKVLETWPDSVRLVFQSFPLDIHARAVAASEAALCAGEQGRYWPMHDLLFSAEGRLSPEELRAAAARAGLDLPAFDACAASGRMKPEVERQKRNGEAAGVAGTPAFFVGGRPLLGERSFESFRRLVEAELAAAAR